MAAWPSLFAFVVGLRPTINKTKNQGKTNCSARFPIPRAVIFGFDFADLFFAFIVFPRSGLPPSLFAAVVGLRPTK